jgi:hypothetical protein
VRLTRLIELAAGFSTIGDGRKRERERERERDKERERRERGATNDQKSHQLLIGEKMC